MAGRGRLLAAFAVVVTILAVFAPSVAIALPDPAPSEITAVASLSKTASVTTVQRGETFTYTLTIGCSSITDTGCKGAVLTDVVPAPFVPIDATVGVGANLAAAPAIVGNTVTVEWVTPLGDGTTGLLDATTGIVTITAKLPDDASHDTDGVAVVNNAAIEGTNFADAQAQVAVTPSVPLALGTTASKSFSPTSALATTGAPVTATVSGSNDSNATVDTLIIQDPATDPPPSPGPFDSLGFVGFGTITPLAGATATTYEVYVSGSGWATVNPDGTLPPAINPDDVLGTRVTFTGAIPAGASATVDLNLAVTVAATTAADGTVVENTVSSRVSRGGDSASDDSSAEFTLRQNAVTVSASKSFNPGLVVAGGNSTVTIGATNTSTIPTESMTLTEPSSGVFPDAYVFDGITAPITAPSPSAGGTVVYHYADGSTEDVNFTSGTIPGPAADPSGVVSFEVRFDGPIGPGSSAAVEFGVTTDPDLDPATLPMNPVNEVLVNAENQGASGSDTAQDDLWIYGEVIAPYIGKNIRPSTIPAVPGQVVTVSLTGGLLERPSPPETPEGSTGNAQQIILQDPQDPVEPNDWWNAFDVIAITQTPIPANAALTIEYYDTTDNTWKTMAGPINGPTIYSAPVPGDVQAVAGGIRFVYDWTGPAGQGFPPGTDFAPNFTSELRGDGRYRPGQPFSDATVTVIPNCAQSEASSVIPGVSPGSATMPVAECPSVELVPTDPGTADVIDKKFGTSSSGGIKTVIARSGDTIPSVLSWSTGGFSGIDHMDITDIASPLTTPLSGSIYNTFNLSRVEAITAASDPHIMYDQVQEVLLWDGTSWSGASNDPCPAACIGQFPGLSLSSQEQQSTTAVRLVFAESPDRINAAAGDPTAPSVGSGVARSSGNDRHVTLTWQVRDTRRSDGTPVLGDELYNTATQGLVHNTVRAQGFPQPGGPVLNAMDADDVLIIDVPLTTTTDKNWSGGPLAVPADPSILVSSYPLSRITITTRNTTPAKVDQLVIREAAPGTTTDRRADVFQAFTFNNFAAITVPAGATTTVVTTFCTGGTSQQHTREQALALTAATACEVSGIEVAFDGRIATNTAGVLSFDVRLRGFWREQPSERVSTADSPILNTAEGVVADVDPAGVCPPAEAARFACDQGSATIVLQEPTFGLTLRKSITPSEQKEGDTSPVTVALTTQPTGSARTTTATLEDSDPSFWNAFDLVGMSPSWTFTSPIGRVQICYRAGGDFTVATVSAANAVAAVGGTLTCSPSFLDVAEASTWLSTADLTAIHGLTFEYWQANADGWQDPPNPVMTTPFVVQRRTELRTGGPVPTTRSDQVIAPGESQLGTFTDTATGDSVSAPISAGVVLTANASAPAQYRYLHLEAAIAVTKSPTGDVLPGVAIPFSLAFTNTGELALLDPVFSDRLPVDDQGVQLILDPDRDPSVPPWSFTLSGAAPTPSNGLPLPTNPRLVDVQDVNNVLYFRMPDGSVLEPGQTYTVTLRLMLRPGLTPDDSIQNWAAIAVDVPLDACVPTVDAATGECIDDAIVRPLAVPALSTVKYVKADNPVQKPGIPAVLSAANGYSCAGTATADGFYRAPCAPVTLPGDSETWRFTIINAGTLPLDQVVSIDNLPTPDDQGLIVQLPRDSMWAPTFLGGVELVDAPPGTSLTTLYSASSVPCTTDLDPLAGGCAPGAWLPLKPDVDPAIVRSLQFRVDFPNALLVPGAAVSIQYVTQTTPTERANAAYPIAYNTVAVGGSAVDGQSRITVPATEGRRVGVTYPVGPISLQKTVTGPAANLAPARFPVRVQCTSAGQAMTGLPLVVLTPGAAPVQVDGLPWGAECTATEGPWGQTSHTITTATVGGPTNPIQVIGIVNDYQIANLTIGKTVDAAGLDQRGTPISYGPFVFDVSCRFLGSAVWADGYDAATPMTAALTPPQTWALTGLPVGAACTVTETQDQNARETSMVVSIGGVAQSPVAGASVDIEIVEGDVGVEVEAVNVFGAGAIELEKVVDGAAADDFGAGPFQFLIQCTIDTGSGPQNAYVGTVTLGDGQPLTATINNIADGARCMIVEIRTGGATSTIIDPGTFTVGDGQIVEVTATNTFDAGSVVVSKVIEGEGAALYGEGPFQVTLACTDGLLGGVDIPGGATRQLDADNGYSTTYEPLRVGLLCRLTESDARGATASTITDAGGSQVSVFRIAEQEYELTVTNDFALGSIIVDKTVSGGASSAHLADIFEIALACAWNGAPLAIPGGATRAIVPGTPVVFGDLPVGADCSVSETDNGGATAATFAPADPSDPTRARVTVGADADVSVSIDNRFDPALPPTGSDAGGALGTTLMAMLIVFGGVYLRRADRRRRTNA